MAERIRAADARSDDLGKGWLRANTVGSGPCALWNWPANRSIQDVSARALAARRGPDAARRAAMQKARQREGQQDNPSVMLFQLTGNSVTRAAVTGPGTGPMRDRYRHAGIKKV